MRTILEIEKDLAFIKRIDERNKDAVKKSTRPQVESVFAASSEKRLIKLEQELVDVFEFEKEKSGNE